LKLLRQLVVLSDKASCTEISESELKKALIEVDYSNIVKAAKGFGTTTE
jgi:hypothetical protein